MAQMIATIQVFISNLALHDKMSWLAQAGYLTVPNQKILPTLSMIAPAFYGGVFFTLSIGIGISLISLVCVWTLKYVCHLKRGFLFGFIGLWAVSIIALNWHGFVLLPTLHAILIPAVVVTLFLLLSPNDMGQRTRMALLLHFLTFSLLVLLWSTQMSSTLYVNIRDNLLLSNTPGIRFNDLYYKYTLYPAEVFRNLNQKLIKTYHFLETSDSREHNRLIRKLSRYDYLPISENGKSDVQIEVRKNRIRLSGSLQSAIEMELDDFFKNTRKALQDLSKNNDAYIHFRAATSISLLVGFPLILYWVFNGLLVQCFSLFLGKQPAVIAGVAACFLIGVLLLLLMPMGHKRDITIDRLPDMLTSGDWKNRVAALQHIDSNKIDLQQFDLTGDLSQHPSIPVRYWLARSLSVGRHPGDEAHLITLMQDPHPNVACQALYSIGKRKFRKITPRLLETIRDSDHWYVQLYTYNALRKLGWKQSISN
jgi:hypothetical protein